MYVKKSTVSVKYYNDAHKKKLVHFFLPHGVVQQNTNRKSCACGLSNDVNINDLE